MLTPQTVLAHMKQLVFLDEAGAASALPLCVTALEELQARLREDARETDIRILNAAAAMAQYKWRLREKAQEETVIGMKAGDVSIQSSNEALAISKTLRDDAMQAVLPLLRDDSFLFRQVEI